MTLMDFSSAMGREIQHNVPRQWNMWSNSVVERMRRLWMIDVYTWANIPTCVFMNICMLCVFWIFIWYIYISYCVYIYCIFVLNVYMKKTFQKEPPPPNWRGEKLLFYFIRNHCLDEWGYFSWNRTPMVASYRLGLECLKSTPCPKIMQSTHLSSWGVCFWQSCHHCHKGTLWSIDLQRPSSAFALEIRSWRWRLGQTPTRWSAWGEGRWQ